MTENVIIIGGGPAGLAASLYTARANFNPLVFAGSPPGGQLILTTEVENYPGFESIMGPELIEKYRHHVQKFGVRLIDQNIIKVDLNTSPFTVLTAQQSYQAKAVIIATGAKALWLGLESETRLRGKGVSACATCDGFFFKDKTVAVVGGGDTAMEEALTLTHFAKKIYLIHRRDMFRCSKIMEQRVRENPKIEIVWNTVVTEILGEKKVEGIKLKTTLPTGDKSQNLTVDGVFIAIGHRPDTDLFKEQLDLDSKGYIITFSRLAEDYLRGMDNLPNEKILKLRAGKHYSTQTSIIGVFAAGDCVDYQYRQAGTAVGMGIAAALDVERWLEMNK